MNSDIQQDYGRLRAELEGLLAAPVKDYLRIDQLVEQLEHLQLAFKAEQGIKGNNPNE